MIKHISRNRLAWTLVIFCVMVLMSFAGNGSSLIGQVDISPTPVQVQIATATPLPTAGLAPTDIPPTFTPTDQGPPQLTPKEGNEVNGVNVRADADIESDILGTIRTGEMYTVTGQFYQWYQFRFDPSPSGLAYVYGELVDIEGDPAAIPDLTESLLPTQDTSIQNSTQTAEAILQAPGGVMTLTASSRIIEAPSGELPPDALTPDPGNESTGSGSTSLVNPPQILPTFTYPPNIVAQAPTDSPDMDINVTATPLPNTVNIDVSEGVAPIVPIVIFMSIGMIGLLLSLIRR